MRLAKYLASAGVASRRTSEQIVRAARVTVGGVTVTDPARDVKPHDAVSVDGQPVQATQLHLVYAVNKPAGVVSTARDPQGRPTVVSLVPSRVRLYPVGRLDIDTTGLILLTNDGELANRLTHPRHEIEKTYRATVANPPVREEALKALRRGVELRDGRTYPARVKRLGPNTLELTIHEGRKRQIKRMCEEVGYPVKSLERTRFGPVALGGLRPGAYRQLSHEEMDALASAGSAARQSGTSSSAARARPRAESASQGARRRAGES